MSGVSGLLPLASCYPSRPGPTHFRAEDPTSLELIESRCRQWVSPTESLFLHSTPWGGNLRRLEKGSASSLGFYSRGHPSLPLPSCPDQAEYTVGRWCRWNASNYPYQNDFHDSELRTGWQMEGQGARSSLQTQQTLLMRGDGLPWALNAHLPVPVLFS